MAEEKKVKFNISSAFIDGKTHELKAPGSYDLDEATAKRFYEQGKGSYENSKDAPKVVENEPVLEGSAPAGNLGEGSGTELPEDFPHRDQLVEAGFDTVEKLRNASDDEILAIEGVGEATMNKIANALEEV